tara:strand:+ start:10039 stop:10266 length:228 start_codon:yes stop_codon:yes gene_type:complete
MDGLAAAVAAGRADVLLSVPTVSHGVAADDEAEDGHITRCLGQSPGHACAGGTSAAAALIGRERRLRELALFPSL